MINTLQDLQKQTSLLQHAIHDRQSLSTHDFCTDRYCFSNEVMKIFSALCTFEIAKSSLLKEQAFCDDKKLRNKAIVRAMERIYSDCIPSGASKYPLRKFVSLPIAEPSLPHLPPTKPSFKRASVGAFTTPHPPAITNQSARPKSKFRKRPPTPYPTILPSVENNPPSKKQTIN